MPQKEILKKKPHRNPLKRQNQSCKIWRGKKLTIWHFDSLIDWLLNWSTDRPTDGIFWSCWCWNYWYSASSLSTCPTFLSKRRFKDCKMFLTISSGNFFLLFLLISNKVGNLGLFLGALEHHFYPHLSSILQSVRRSVCPSKRTQWPSLQPFSHLTSHISHCSLHIRFSVLLSVWILH